MTSRTHVGLTKRALQQFVSDWYSALDQHVPFEEVETFLDATQVRFVFPEVTVDTREGLRDWYERVTRTFFDEIHSVDRTVIEIDGNRAQVQVGVNWTTRVWDPPKASSQILSYNSDQSWEIVVGADGRPGLRTYVVNTLTPIGDTPPLV